MVCFNFIYGQQKIRGSVDTFPFIIPTETIIDDKSDTKIDNCKEFNSGGLSGLNEFASPGYPRKYPPNIDCVRIIFAPSSYDILLHFRNIFQIETSYEDAIDSSGNEDDISSYSTRISNCPNDYLEVRDGRYSFSPLIGQFCGMKTPTSEIRAKSGYMWLHFHSDNLLEYRGFMAEYEFIRGPIYGNQLYKPINCYYSYTMPLDGVIDIDLLKDFYINNRNNTGSLECVWQIQVPQWLSIAIFIEEFILYQPNQCHKNFLEIYSGMISNNPLKRYCGITANHVYSNQPIVFIRFYSSDYNSLYNTKIKLLFSTYIALKNCSLHNLYSCGDDICIPHELVCSGRSNCLYGRDELNCYKNENVKSFILSSYGTLILIVIIVVIIVVGLFYWYNPCNVKNDNNNIDSYLKDLCSEPPPGVNQKPRRQTSKRIKQFITNVINHSGNTTPSMSESITLTDLTHHLNCSNIPSSSSAFKPSNKINGIIPNEDLNYESQNELNQTKSSLSSSITSINRPKIDCIPYNPPPPSTSSSFTTLHARDIPRIFTSKRLHSIQLDTLRRKTSTETVIEVADEDEIETSFCDDSHDTIIL